MKLCVMNLERVNSAYCCRQKLFILNSIFAPVQEIWIRISINYCLVVFTLKVLMSHRVLHKLSIGPNYTIQGCLGKLGNAWDLRLFHIGLVNKICKTNCRLSVPIVFFVNATNWLDTTSAFAMARMQGQQIHASNCCPPSLLFAETARTVLRYKSNDDLLRKCIIW